MHVNWPLTRCSSDSNVSFQVPLAGDRRSYMLHPLYSKVLLESTSSQDHIVTFKGALTNCIATCESVVGGMWKHRVRPFVWPHLCFCLSYAVGAGTPRCLHPADRSGDGGSWRHCGPQQAKAEAGRPWQQRTPYWHRRKFRDQRGHQRGLQSSPLQRLVKGPTVTWTVHPQFGTAGCSMA